MNNLFKYFHTKKQLKTLLISKKLNESFKIYF